MRTRHCSTFGLAALATAFSTWALAQEQGSTAAGAEGEIEEQTAATFIDTDGTEVGGANVTDVPSGGVLIGLQVEGLPAGNWHAVHIHEGGECNPEDGFESAGGHYNPEDREHGYYMPGGVHAGDMPNQYVGEDGVLRSQILNPQVSLDGDQASIRGRTIVVHSQQDDYESQPSGNAGDRLACAVIEAQ